jgi:hypothetical protein
LQKRNGTFRNLSSVSAPWLDLKTWRLSMTNNVGKWTEWWWFRVSGLRTWTWEERKVRLALGATVIVVFLIIDFPLAALLQFGVGLHGAELSGIVSIVLAFFAARPIATIVFPDALRRADENSQRRLSQRAPRPTISPDALRRADENSPRRLRGPAIRSTKPEPRSTVLSFVSVGAHVGLATLFVLLVPIMPFLLSLDPHVRQRAGDAIWESASGHSRPYAGPFPLVDVRFPGKSPDLSPNER